MATVTHHLAADALPGDYGTLLEDKGRAHSMIAPQLYHRITNGIRVTVRPVFAPEHSDPDEPRYVFVYFIRIENIGDRTARLMRRHWYIHDASAGDSEVEGEGVVGEQPTLAPGDVHEYQSFCVLKGSEGHMEGNYRFRRSDGEEFNVVIPRFLLRAFDA